MHCPFVLFTLAFELNVMFQVEQMDDEVSMMNRAWNSSELF